MLDSTATVLTCGQLRLRVPPAAPIPSIRMSPESAAVELQFHNFSGTVVFEPVDTPSPPLAAKPHKPAKQSLAHSAKSKHHKKKNKQPVNTFTRFSRNAAAKPLVKQPPRSSDPRDDPENHQAPISADDADAHSQPQSQQSQPLPTRIPPPPADLSPKQAPLNTPSLQKQPHGNSPLLSQPSPLADPMHLPDSSALSDPLQLPSSFHLSHHDPFPLSQLPSQPLPSQTISPAFPASQIPEMPSSADLPPTSDTPPQPPPMADHFARAYMPLSPPSDHDDNNDDHLLDTTVYSPPRLPSAKRSAPELAVKTGKRVRFQSDPEVFSPPPLQSSPEPDKEPASEPSPLPVVMPAAPAKPSPWRTVSIEEQGGLPARRWGASFTRLDNETVVLLGGESERDDFFKEMAVLHVTERRWLKDGKDTPEMPHGGRAWHTTTCIDSNLFVFGGEREIKGERTQTNDVLMYDTTYFTWYPPALSGTAPSARAGHCAALIPDTNNIVIYGGINGNKWLNDLHLLEDLAMWSKVRTTAKSARPSVRSYASLTAAADFLVLFGGNNKTKCFNDVHLLKPGDLSWSEPVILGRAPRARTGHCAVASKDRKGVVVYGGWDDQGAQRLFYSDVWELRIKGETECQWTCLFAGDSSSKTPGPRAGAALTKVGADGRMLLFGGWHQFSYFNDITELVLPFKKGRSALAGGSER